jgi:hypothetical protein
VTPPTVALLPTRNTLLKRSRPRNAVNGRPSDTDAAASLSAAAPDHRPACPGAHSRPEAVDLVTATHVRLVGALHDDGSEVGGSPTQPMSHVVENQRARRERFPCRPYSRAAPPPPIIFLVGGRDSQ